MLARLMLLRRRSRAGSEEARQAFLPQQERSIAPSSPRGWKALWTSQQWVIVAFGIGFGLLMLYVLAVSVLGRWIFTMYKLTHTTAYDNRTIAGCGAERGNTTFKFTCVDPGIVSKC